jgi:hypothetical protein
MGWAAAAPIIASTVGGLLQSKGNKKAAGASPQIPGVFTGPVTDASRLLWSRILNGFPAYQGQLTAGATPLQQNALTAASGLMGQGQAGMDSAWQTLLRGATEGMGQSDIDLAMKQTNPLFEYQKTRSVGSMREAQAQGGRFFSTGALGQEGDLLAQMEANYSSQVLPLAMQMQQMRTQTAQSLPGFLQNIFGLGEGERQIQQQGLSAQMAEWLRTQPEAAISMLAGLMSGTPFYNPATAPNAWQTIGSGISGLGQSAGFQKSIQDWLYPATPPKQ